MLSYILDSKEVKDEKLREKEIDKEVTTTRGYFYRVTVAAKVKVSQKKSCQLLHLRTGSTSPILHVVSLARILRPTHCNEIKLE